MVNLTGVVKNLVGLLCTVKNAFDKWNMCVSETENREVEVNYNNDVIYDDFMMEVDHNDSSDGEEFDIDVPQIFEEDQYGPDLNIKVKNLVQKACSQEAPELNKVTDKYLVPKSSSDFLRVLKINRDIWSELYVLELILGSLL